jgi:hypothetical protein
LIERIVHPQQALYRKAGRQFAELSDPEIARMGEITSLSESSPIALRN